MMHLRPRVAPWTPHVGAPGPSPGGHEPEETVFGREGVAGGGSVEPGGLPATGDREDAEFHVEASTRYCHDESGSDRLHVSLRA